MIFAGHRIEALPTPAGSHRAYIDGEPTDIIRRSATAVITEAVAMLVEREASPTVVDFAAERDRRRQEQADALFDYRLYGGG